MDALRTSVRKRFKNSFYKDGADLLHSEVSGHWLHYSVC
jgi:hypothetical protein